MKYLLLYLAFVAVANKTFAQVTEDSVSYLVIKIKTERDYKKKSNFCFLDIEKGNKYAGELYALSNYQNKLPHDDAVYDKANKKIDSSFEKTSINYFENTTAALNYLAKLNWYLDHIVPNISSSLETEMAIGERANYTKIVSDPLFIFKKILKR